jgi:hypothetical protein
MYCPGYIGDGVGYIGEIGVRSSGCFYCNFFNIYPSNNLAMVR